MPRPLEVEGEFVPAIGDKNVAYSDIDLLAATADPSLALQVHAGGVDVIARLPDMRACMGSKDAEARDVGNCKLSDRAHLCATAQRVIAGRLDPHRRYVPADEIRPEFNALTR
jgi:hypothetical protein